MALATTLVVLTAACADTGVSGTTLIDPNEATPRGGLVLGADGLGVIDFGATPEDTFAAVAAALGREPDTDTNWIDAFAAFGTCPGTVVRALTWGDLMVIAGDAESELVAPGTRHFYSYRYRLGRQGPEGLVTEEGVGLESTVAELEAAYGDAVVLFPLETVLGGPRYEVNPIPGNDILLSGIVSAATSDGLVLWIDGGVGCATSI